MVALASTCCYGQSSSNTGGDETGYAVVFIIVAVFVGILIYGYSVAEPYKPGYGPVTTTKVTTIRGDGDAQIVCPHCQTRGLVTTRHVKLKKGVSGGKIVASVLTSGLSLLAVGLSRKEAATEAKCSNCGSVWHF